MDSALTFRILQPLQVAQCCKYLDKDEGVARAEPKASLKHLFLGRESTQITEHVAWTADTLINRRAVWKKPPLRAGHTEHASAFLCGQAARIFGWIHQCD